MTYFQKIGLKAIETAQTVGELVSVCGVLAGT